ncbi:unnamed protein product [Rangifer tarandus platyrhynchus]|uniref:Uncharacterized protein n=1 Tax=Rangifer tarandus platyrhynchus TaxID=3082113 RepID=A0ABN8Y329_RANTA|nr:unnamed protein product [Rangifer tarandus platyrhynchus]
MSSATACYVVGSASLPSRRLPKSLDPTLCFRKEIKRGKGFEFLVLILTREIAWSRKLIAPCSDSGTQRPYPVYFFLLLHSIPRESDVPPPLKKKTDHKSYGTLVLRVQGAGQGEADIPANLRMSLEGSTSLCYETLLALFALQR